MSKLLNILFVALFLFGGGVWAHAQTLGQMNTVEFSVTPEAPGPNEPVTIEAQGVGGFLNDATITWQKDGKTVLSGQGERIFSFVTGASGSQTRVHATVNSASEGTFTKDFLFTPNLVNLIWEANTSVPPLYRGKALYSPGSQIKVVALPQVISSSALVPVNKLSFAWSINDNPASSQSGLGRSVFTYNGNQLNQGETISVIVSYGSNTVGHGEVSIPAVNPGILVYVEDPLRGTLFDQALPSNVSLVGKEVTLNAQPYYFANESLNSQSSYTWSLNGQTITGPDSAHGILTLRQAGSGTGASSLGVELQNNNNTQFLQTARTVLQIIFGQQSGTGSTFGI